jgi:hypothetical protein
MEVFDAAQGDGDQRQKGRELSRERRRKSGALHQLNLRPPMWKPASEAPDGVVVMTKIDDERYIVEAEREACAKLIESIKMGEILLAAGEMTAQERRTVKALLPWLANRIRNR